MPLDFEKSREELAKDIIRTNIDTTDGKADIIKIPEPIEITPEETSKLLLSTEGFPEKVKRQIELQGKTADSTITDYFKKRNKQIEFLDFDIKETENKINKSKSPQESFVLTKGLLTKKREKYLLTDEGRYFNDLLKNVLYGSKGEEKLSLTEFGRYLQKHSKSIEKKYPFMEYRSFFIEHPQLKGHVDDFSWKSLGEKLSKKTLFKNIYGEGSVEGTRNIYRPFHKAIRDKQDIYKSWDEMEDAVAKMQAGVDVSKPLKVRGKAKTFLSAISNVAKDTLNDWDSLWGLLGGDESDRKLAQSKIDLDLAEQRVLAKDNPNVYNAGKMAGYLTTALLEWQVAGAITRSLGVGNLARNINKAKWFKSLAKSSPQASLKIFNALERGADFAGRGALLNVVKKMPDVVYEDNLELKKAMGTLPEEIVSGFVLGATDIIGKAKAIRLLVGAVVGALESTYRIKSRGGTVSEERNQFVFNTVLSGLMNTFYSEMRPLEIDGKVISAPGISEVDMSRRITTISKKLAKKYQLDSKDIQKRIETSVDEYMGYPVSRTGLSFNKALESKLNGIVAERSKTIGDKNASIEVKDLTKRIFKIIKDIEKGNSSGAEKGVNEVISQPVTKGAEIRDTIEDIASRFEELPGKSSAIFEKLNRNIKDGQLKVKENKNYLQSMFSVINKISEQNEGRAVTPEMAIGFFKKNKNLWQLFKTDAERLNAKIDFDQLGVKIFDKQLETEQKVWRADNIDSAKSSIIELIERTSHWTEDFDTKNFKAPEIKRRKAIKKELFNMFHKLGKTINVKNQAAWSLWTGLDQPFYNMLLSGKMRWFEIFKKAMDTIYAELNPRERELYETVLNLYGEYANPLNIVNENFNKTFKNYLSRVERGRKFSEESVNKVRVRHRGYVQNAIENGVDVPKEVLKDYPDLANIKVVKKSQKPNDVVRRSFDDIRRQAKNTEETEKAEEIIADIESFLKENNVQKLIDFQERITNPINEAFTSMTKRFGEGGDIKPPLGLNYVVERRLASQLQDLSIKFINNLTEAGAIRGAEVDINKINMPDVIDKSGAVPPETEIRNMLDNPKMTKVRFIRTLKDMDIIRPENRESIVSAIDDLFGVRGGILQRQKFYNPLIIRDDNMSDIVSPTDPKLSFVQKMAQRERKISPVYADLKHWYRMKDPSQVYTYRFSDYFHKLEQAYIFDTFSKMRIDFDNKRVPFLIDKKDVEKWRNVIGSKSFERNFPRISSKHSKDLDGWHAKKEFVEVIGDLIDNQRRASAIVRAGHFLKRRMLYKGIIMTKNDGVQIGVADPRAFRNIAEGYKEFKNKGLKFLRYDRLNLYNTLIGISDDARRQMEDISIFYKDTKEVGMLDKFFNATRPGQFIKEVHKATEKGLDKIQTTTWEADKVMRTALAIQYEKNGFSPEMAVEKTQLAMAHYSRLSIKTRRALSIPIMFGNYRIQMLRLHKELISHPFKNRHKILNAWVMKLMTRGLLGYFGYKPVKSNITRFAENQGLSKGGVVNEALDTLTQYRYEKINPKTGERKITTMSAPIYELDKYINRNLSSILKYNAGVFPALYMQLVDNRGFDNKPITDVPLEELVHGLREGIYNKYDLAKYFGQMSFFAFKQYFPPVSDVVKVGELVADKLGDNEKNAVEEMLGIGGVAFVYTYTKDLNRLKKQLKKAVAENDQTKVSAINRETKKTQLFLNALRLVKEKKVDLDTAMRIIYLSGKKGRMTRPEAAELIRITGGRK